MRFLQEDEVLQEIRAAVTGASKVILASGFIKSGFLKRLGIEKPPENLQVYGRWRLSDLLGGGSDAVAYEEARKLGGKFFVHPRLHAKVFVIDEKLFVGSANLSHSGLPTHYGTGNKEAVIKLSNSELANDFLQKLSDESITLNDTVYAALLDELAAHPPLPAATDLLADKATRLPIAIENAARLQILKPLHAIDLPWTSSVQEVLQRYGAPENVEHDVNTFSTKLNPTKEDLRQGFMLSRGYGWLMAQGTDPLRFGTLTASLHTALNDDPKPYRSEVKTLLANLLNWMEECAPDQVEVVRYTRTATYKFRNI